MMDSAVESSPDNSHSGQLLGIYRAIGLVEGRVNGLERDMTEMKGGIAAMQKQVNEIHTIITTDRGLENGAQNAYGRVGRLIERIVTIGLAALTAWLTVKYSNLK